MLLINDLLHGISTGQPPVLHLIGLRHKSSTELNWLISTKNKKEENVKHNFFRISFFFLFKEKRSETTILEKPFGCVMYFLISNSLYQLMTTL